MDGLGTTEQAHVYGVGGLHGNGKVKPGVAIGKGYYANGWMTAEDKIRYSKVVRIVRIQAQA